MENPKAITQAKAQEIKRLLVKTNLFKKKEEIISYFSVAQRKHIADLTDDEAVKCIDYLNELDVRGNNMRRKMLSLGYEMHFHEPLSRAEEAMQSKDLNFRHVSSWCESEKCKYRKPLRSLDPFELEEVVTQFTLVRNSFTQTLRKRNEQKTGNTKAH